MSAPGTDRIIAECREIMHRGSKSFAAASRLLAPDTRESVYMLYAWCRYCDDQIDMQDLGRNAPADATATGHDRLARLERETLEALAGKATSGTPFIALQRVVERHHIPHIHPLDLLRGFAMDVEGHRYRKLEDSSRYCYHVAGVVGVMMALVMGSDRPEILDRAADLGIALQMTNIARDVIDDAGAGRVYLPLDWLEEAGVPAEEIALPQHRAALLQVVQRFLGVAERYYDSSTAGLPSLSGRSAWAVAAARRVYREIGRQVIAGGASAWDGRVFVGRPKKAFLVASAGWDAIASRRSGSGLPSPSRAGLWTRPSRRGEAASP